MVLTDRLISELRSQNPSLPDLPGATFRDDLQSGATLLNAAAGDVLFDEGMSCQGFPLVLKGEICVSRCSADGARTMELYRVAPGEICAVSAKPSDHGGAAPSIRLNTMGGRRSTMRRVVPWPGTLSMFNWAPIRSACSRKPTMP